VLYKIQVAVYGNKIKNLRRSGFYTQCVH